MSLFKSFSFAVALATLLVIPALAAPPEVSGLFPPGVEQGKTVTVAVVGKVDTWPVDVWVSRAGLNVTCAEKKGQLKIQAEPNAEPGIYWIRLYNSEGAASLRPFVVGQQTELVEQEPNDRYDKPQRISTESATINGRLGKTGDVDTFSMSVKRGQTLVAAVTANHRLGAPMDAVLQVLDARGFVLSQNDDERGIDPGLVFTAKRDGEYRVRMFAFPETPNSSVRFAGGESYIYRLQLTTRGFVDHAYPLAVPFGKSSTAIELRGWNLPKDAQANAVASGKDAAVVSHKEFNFAGTVQRVPHAAAVEQEPNSCTRPQRIDWPVTVSGHVDANGDEDAYAFAAKKGEAVSFRVASRSLGFSLDPVLRLLDATGKELRSLDDDRGSKDATLSYRFPAAGDYTVCVRDLHSVGGLRYAYRLTIAESVLGYTLSVATDRFTITRGKPLEIPVTVTRDRGFTQEIEVVAELPNGVKAAAVKSLAKGPTAKQVKLQLTADVDPLQARLRIVGRSADAKETSERAATVAISGNKRVDWLWLTVLPEMKKK